MASFSRFSSSPITQADTRRRNRGVQALAQERIGRVKPAAKTNPYAALAAESEAAAPGSLAAQAAGATGTMTAQRNLRNDPANAGAVARHEQAVRYGPVTNPFDLGAVRGEHAEELEAAEKDYASAEARARADAEARGGLGGLGLSGATQALVRDTGLRAANERAKGIAALKEQQRNELRGTVIDHANLLDLVDNGVDLSAIDPSLKPSAEQIAENEEEEAREALGLEGTPGFDIASGFGSGFDIDGAPGSPSRPYKLDPADRAKVEAAYGELTPAPYNPTWGPSYLLFRDKAGRHFYFGQNSAGAQ